MLSSDFTQSGGNPSRSRAVIGLSASAAPEGGDGYDMNDATGEPVKGSTPVEPPIGELPVLKYRLTSSSDLEGLLLGQDLLMQGLSEKLGPVLEELDDERALIEIISHLPDETDIGEEENFLQTFDLDVYDNEDVRLCARHLINNAEASLDSLRRLLKMAEALKEADTWMGADAFEAVSKAGKDPLKYFVALCQFLGLPELLMTTIIQMGISIGVTQGTDVSLIWEALKVTKLYLDAEVTDRFLKTLQTMREGLRQVTYLDLLPRWLDLDQFFEAYRDLATEPMRRDIYKDNFSTSEVESLKHIIEEHFEVFDPDDIQEALLSLYRGSVHFPTDEFQADIIALVRCLSLCISDERLTREFIGDVKDDLMDLGEALETTHGDLEGARSLLAFHRSLEDLRYDAVEDAVHPFWNLSLREAVDKFSEVHLINFVLEFSVYLHPYGVYLTEDQVVESIRDLLNWELSVPHEGTWYSDILDDEESSDISSYDESDSDSYEESSDKESADEEVEDIPSGKEPRSEIPAASPEAHQREMQDDDPINAEVPEATELLSPVDRDGNAEDDASSDDTSDGESEAERADVVDLLWSCFGEPKKHVLPWTLDMRTAFMDSVDFFEESMESTDQNLEEAVEYMKQKREVFKDSKVFTMPRAIHNQVTSKLIDALLELRFFEELPVHEANGLRGCVRRATVEGHDNWTFNSGQFVWEVLKNFDLIGHEDITQMLTRQVYEQAFPRSESEDDEYL